jgi:hypothetical protein
MLLQKMNFFPVKFSFHSKTKLKSFSMMKTVLLWVLCTPNIKSFKSVFFYLNLTRLKIYCKSICFLTYFSCKFIRRVSKDYIQLQQCKKANYIQIKWSLSTSLLEFSQRYIRVKVGSNSSVKKFSDFSLNVKTRVSCNQFKFFASQKLFSHLPNCSAM